MYNAQLWEKGGVEPQANTGHQCSNSPAVLVLFLRLRQCLTSATALGSKFSVGRSRLNEAGQVSNGGRVASRTHLPCRLVKDNAPGDTGSQRRPQNRRRVRCRLRSDVWGIQLIHLLTCLSLRLSFQSSHGDPFSQKIPCLTGTQRTRSRRAVKC